MRRPIALAVIALHGLALWLLVIASRSRFEEEPEQPQFVSLWLTPLTPLVPEPPRAAAPLLPTTVTPTTVAPGRQPITAPTLTAPITLPAAPTTPTPESTAAAPASTPSVDWASATNLAARRAAEAAAPKQDTFSPPPKVLPKPCVPKKKSMEWEGEQDRRVGVKGGLPYIKLNDRCMLIVIIPVCVIGKLPEANSHLLDDMKDPDRSRSSVPDPNVCD